MNHSDNALKIYQRLYFNDKLNETTPEQVHERVAKFISNNDSEYIKFKEILDNNIFRPNTPCLINAGGTGKKDYDNNLIACFVIGLEDDMDSIIEMWSTCSKIYAGGAGVGIPITNLREYGSPISSGGGASGPLKYLQVIEIVSDVVRSGGRTRRAANLATFKYNHPEVLQIIESKIGNKNLQSFNLSMSVTNKFMNQLLNNSEKEIELISPNKNKIIAPIQIKEIWNKTIQTAWATGDPGLLFIDTANKFNPFPSVGTIETTNPCGEIPLIPWTSCNLGSINVSKFYNKNSNSIDWVKFSKVIHICNTFLDNVIDKSAYIHPNFEANTKIYRPLGLGIMGFADLLLKLGIPYGSDKSIKLLEALSKTLTHESIRNSINMVKEGKRPIDIPDTDKDNFYQLIEYYTGNSSDLIPLIEKYGIRNSTWTCIAPTGSIAISADCSYAWEPHMALIWEKKLVDTNETLKISLPKFEEEFLNKLTPDIKKSKKEIINDIIKNNGSIQKLDYIPQFFKDKYKVAHDIDPMKKIEMQSVAQRYISQAISSTCNLPNSATIKDVDKIYKEAWKKGLKGITVYRDGSHEDQLISFGKKGTPIIEEKIKPYKRPIKRTGDTVEIKTPHGKLFITCNYNSIDKNKPFEIFFKIGKQGSLTNVLVDALGRVCSKAMQYKTPIEAIAETLRGLSGEKFWFQIAEEAEKSTGAESIVDAIALIIDYHFTNKLKEKKEEIKTPDILLEKCPICFKQTLTHASGCRNGLCLSCGYSSCS